MKPKDRNQYWNNYVSKHGKPIVEIVHEVETRGEAVELELKYIAQYGRRCDGSGCLVNITIGGDGGALGVIQSEEHKRKVSEKNRGKVRTPEMRERYRAAQNTPEMKALQAKIKSDPVWLEKQRRAKLGGKHTDEHRAKIAAGNTGRFKSEAEKAKISASKRGVPKSAEHRAKIGDAFRGKKHTEQHKTNKANAQKKVVLNTLTGIYYHGLQEAAESVPMNINTLRSKISGHLKNNTPFVYA